jgi:hypothetical protein
LLRRLTGTIILIYAISTTFVFVVSGVADEKNPILHAGTVGPNRRHFVLSESAWGARWEGEVWNAINERRECEEGKTTGSERMHEKER